MRFVGLLLLTLLLVWLISSQALAFQPGGFRQVSYAPAYAYYPRPPQLGGYRPAPYGHPYYRHYRQPMQPASPVNSSPRTLDEKSPGRVESAKPKPLIAKAAALTKPESSDKQGSDHKKRFLEGLIPLIRQENERILTLRSELGRLLARLDAGQTVSERESQRLEKLARHYRVEGNVLKQSEARSELLDRIDIIPVSLALAQAATESAWGKSRFAREANNLFGIWTYDESKGLVPKRREAGKTHLVRKFDSRGESVRYYMHNLNTHPAYKALRRIRAEHRRRGESLDGMDLAEGLERYSAKGREYIEMIQRMIKQNSLALLDGGKQSA